jgi:hypothetical protein
MAQISKYFGWLRVVPIWAGLMSGSFSIVREIVGLYSTNPSPFWQKNVFWSCVWITFVIAMLIAWFIKNQELNAEKAKREKPDIQGEIKEVHEFSGTSNSGFDYFFTLNVFLRNKGRAIGIRDYSLRMIQGDHTYTGEKSSLKSYCLERKEPHPGKSFAGTEMKAVEYPLLDLGDMKNVPLDSVGRDGWIRFAVRGVRFFEDEWEEDGNTRILKKVELTIIADDGTKLILESSQPFQATGEIRECTKPPMPVHRL